MNSDPPAKHPPPPPPVPPNRVEAIGSRLRQIFEEDAAEPIPEAFEDLLRKLG